MLELVRETETAEYLDPRAGFERRRLRVEVRRDPLTGQSSRLLPPGSVPPPAPLDLDRLGAATRADCPFCGGRVDEQTPRLPPEVLPAGRIRRGEAVLFPNLVPYAKWSSVSVYSPDRHVLAPEALTPRLLADNLATQVEFARAVGAHDPRSGWASVNANHLPPSGSSVFHPHLQGMVDPRPTTMQRLLAGVPAERFREYVETERALGERHVATTASVEWVAAFAPVGPAELRAFLLDAASPTDLDEDRLEELARGIAAGLSVLAELGFQSFNLALYGSPGGTPLTVRLVGRAFIGPLGRSDAMWSERLHWESATDIPPERVAELARARLA